MIISQGLSRVTAEPCQDQSGYACVCESVSIYIYYNQADRNKVGDGYKNLQF